jgi:hypothetical protein
VVGRDDGQRRVVEQLIAGLVAGGVRAITVSTRRPGSTRAAHRVVAIPAEASPDLWRNEPGSARSDFLTAVYSQALGRGHSLPQAQRVALHDAIAQMVSEQHKPDAVCLIARLEKVAKLATVARPDADLACELADRLRRLISTEGWEWLAGTSSRWPVKADWLVCRPSCTEAVPLLVWSAIDQAACELTRAYQSGHVAAGVIVIGDGDLLLAAPESAAWLAQLVGRARRLGLMVIAFCREPATLTMAHARRAAKAFSLVTAAARAMREQPGLAGVLGLGGDDLSVPTDLDREHDTPVYWVNGGRGRGLLVPPAPDVASSPAKKTVTNLGRHNEPRARSRARRSQAKTRTGVLE